MVIVMLDMECSACAAIDRRTSYGATVLFGRNHLEESGNKISIAHKRETHIIDKSTNAIITAQFVAPASD